MNHDKIEGFQLCMNGYCGIAMYTCCSTCELPKLFCTSFAALPMLQLLPGYSVARQHSGNMISPN